MCSPVKVLFLDESGDHNLAAIDENYPVFVLGGVIVDKDYAEGPLAEAFDQFKHELFGRTDIALHTADIVRNRNGFEKLRDPEFRTRFFNALNSLMRELPYEAVACAFHKGDYLKRYGRNAINPYHLGLRVMVELLCDVAGPSTRRGAIIAEKRGDSLDQEVDDTWRVLRTRGARYAEADVIRESIQSLELRDKKDNIAGLQLADLIVSPIGRHILGKLDRDDWKIVEEKLRRGPNGCINNYGLFIFPTE